MGKFCFTVDDNIRFLKELTQQRPADMFEHPYLAMYRRLHEQFGLKVQLNLFYKLEDFDLSQMTDAYRAQWEACSDWLKLSFHSEWENVCPYEFSGYGEVYDHCKAVQAQILRFAGEKSLGSTTTVHYCRTTEEGLEALKDNGVQGLLGLFGTPEKPRSSYGVPEALCVKLRAGELVSYRDITMAPIDIVLNDCTVPQILARLKELNGRQQIDVMIHEQYFYPDYVQYHPDYEQELAQTFQFLCDHGYQSTFLEKCI